MQSDLYNYCDGFLSSYTHPGCDNPWVPISGGAVTYSTLHLHRIEPQKIVHKLAITLVKQDNECDY